MARQASGASSEQLLHQFTGLAVQGALQLVLDEAQTDDIDIGSACPSDFTGR